MPEPTRPTTVCSSPICTLVLKPNSCTRAITASMWTWGASACITTIMGSLLMKQGGGPGSYGKSSGLGGRAVGAQGLGAAHVDMLDVGLGQGRVPVDQHADAVGRLARHVHLLGAHQGEVHPAELAGGLGRKSGVQVGRGREPDARDVGGL